MKVGAFLRAIWLACILFGTCAEGAARSLRAHSSFRFALRRNDSAAGNVTVNKSNHSKGPTDDDHFQEEIVDQADPEFSLASGGDDCISWKDVLLQLEAQFQDGSPDRQGMTDEERQALEHSKRDAKEELALMFMNADGNEDGCVDREEFARVQEMEGPAESGFNETGEQNAVDYCERCMVELGKDIDDIFDGLDTNNDTKVTFGEWDLGEPYLRMKGDGLMAVECGIHIFDFLWQTADFDGDGRISKHDLHGIFAEFEHDPDTFRVWLDGEFEHETEDEAIFEFDCMDGNGDRRVSEEETFHYAMDSMPHADISPEKLKEIFDACDTDKDGFLNLEEFVNAGANFQGDGDEKIAAVEPQALHQLPPVMHPAPSRLAAPLLHSAGRSSGITTSKGAHVTRDFMASLYRIVGKPRSPPSSFRHALGLELRKQRYKIARLALKSSIRPVISTPSFLGKTKRLPKPTPGK